MSALRGSVHTYQLADYAVDRFIADAYASEKHVLPLTRRGLLDAEAQRKNEQAIAELRAELEAA